MKVAGRSDCYITTVWAAGGLHRFNEEFTSIVNFLTGSYAQDLGIQLIAGNRGQSPKGADGFGYWDESNATGPRTFAVFRFLSASNGPFECMIWACSGSGQSGNPMQPGGVAVTATVESLFINDAVVGISFACHASGSTTSPWNGETSLTSASIGSPVWKTGSLGELNVFPRMNTDTIYPNLNYLLPLATDGTTANMDVATQLRMHIIATESSLVIVRTPTANSSVITGFVPYTPIIGTEYGSPYLMWSNPGLSAAAENLSPIIAGTSYGGSAGTFKRSTAQYVGGIAHPRMANQNATNRNYTPNLVFHPLSAYNVSTTLGGINQFIGNKGTGSYELIPTWVACNDTGIDAGLLGVVEHLYLGCGMTQNALTPTSSSIAVGSVLATGVKIIIPWSGSFPGAAGTDRSGRDWSLTDWIPG